MAHGGSPPQISQKGSLAFKRFLDLVPNQVPKSCPIVNASRLQSSKGSGVGPHASKQVPKKLTPDDASSYKVPKKVPGGFF